MKTKKKTKPTMNLRRGPGRPPKAATTRVVIAGPESEALHDLADRLNTTAEDLVRRLVRRVTGTVDPIEKLLSNRLTDGRRYKRKGKV